MPHRNSNPLGTGNQTPAYDQDAPLKHVDPRFFPNPITPTLFELRPTYHNPKSSSRAYQNPLGVLEVATAWQRNPQARRFAFVTMFAIRGILPCFHG